MSRDIEMLKAKIDLSSHWRHSSMAMNPIQFQHLGWVIDTVP
jgi:hypothetical protein